MCDNGLCRLVLLHQQVQFEILMVHELPNIVVTVEFRFVVFSSVVVVGSLVGWLVWFVCSLYVVTCSIENHVQVLQLRY